MTAKEIVSALDGSVIIQGTFNDKIKDFYAGDFLSRVMGKAPINCAWFTIMSNVNVAGVAVLAEVACIILCENVAPEPMLKTKCQSEGIWLITTALSVYDCCKRVSA